MLITMSQHCNAAAGSHNRSTQTCCEKCCFLLSDPLSDGGQTCFISKMQRKSPKSCHSVNCTYYANVLHLNCNHKRQGPSGSDDRCQPLIINVSSVKSALRLPGYTRALIFHPDTGLTFIFSLLACNHRVKPRCHCMIFQKDFWLMILWNGGVQWDRRMEMFIKTIWGKEEGY